MKITNRPVRARRLNFREILPIRSPRHPGHLSTAPSDALAVLWLEAEDKDGEPRFAYLNHARATHLLTELARALRAPNDPSAAERVQHMLHATEGARGEASGA